MTAKKDKRIVDGFEFENSTEAAQAVKEIEGIQYIREKTDMDNPEVVLQVYNKVILQRLFQTPVGLSYLKEMQKYLQTDLSIRNEDIFPIRVQHTVLKQDIYRSAGIEEKERKISIKEKKAANADYKKRYEVTRFFGIVLTICVAAMFIITATGNNVNILNYENALINKYEVWEQELNEREQVVKEKEQALGIIYKKQ